MAKTLLTGASGYLGKKMLDNLLVEGQEVIAPLRATSQSDFENRKQDFLRHINPSHHLQLNLVPGDLASLRESSKSQRGSIHRIVHNAAVTAFNVDEQTANRVNRDGTREMLMLAQECPHLEQFLYISTVYASGMTAGSVEEKLFESRPIFANHYERSKWESENMLGTEFKNLPWIIARVATVIAEDESGVVIQQNAIHNTLKLFFYGLISLLPGLKQTPIYLVEGNFVAAALSEIMVRAKAHQIFHVCHDRSVAVGLERFMDLAFEEFMRDESFSSRRLLKPLFADEKSFETLASNMKNFGGSVLSQGLASIAPFGKQLFVEKNISNHELQSVLGNYQSPDMELLIRRTCAFLAKSKFARRSQ